jgi:hypothetical protein
MPPIKGGAVNIQERGHVFAALAVVDQLPGVVDLVRRRFPLAPEFHASRFRGLHSGACAL